MRRTTGGRVLAAMIGVLLVAAACSSSGDDADDDGGASGDGDTGGGLDAAPGAADGGDTTGVTDDTIRIGALINDNDELAELGFGVEIGDTVEQYRTFFESIEVAGRSVELVTAPFSSVTQETQREACLQLTQDEEVFLVVGLGGPQPENMLCITEENETPLFMTTGFEQEIFDRSAGRLFGTNPPLDRSMAEAARVLAERGDLDDLTIGVVLGDNLSDRNIVDDGLLPALEEAGIEVAAEVTLPCDGAVCEQYESGVQQLRDAGVDGVFNTVSVVAFTNLVAAGNEVGFVPQYFATPVGNADQDVLIQRMEGAGDAYDGALAVTASSRPWTIGRPPSDFEQACNDTYTEATGVTHEYGIPQEDSGFGAVATVCSQATIVETALTAAGEDLTEERFIAAMEQQSEVMLTNLAGETGSFRPDKHWAVEDVTVLVYDPACACWVADGDGETYPIE